MEQDKDSRAVSRRRFLHAAATVVGGLALTACGGATNSGTQAGATAPAGEAAAPAGDPAAPTTPAASTADVSITTWYWGDTLQYVMPDFEKKFPNIKVKNENVPFADAHKKLLTSIAAGTGAPDVASIEGGQVANFTSKGGMVDLLGYDAAQFKNDMIEYKWVHGMTEDQRLICMPWDVAPGGLWYRADLFEKAGLSSDPQQIQDRVKTWDDWFGLGEDLKTKLPETALVADAFSDILTPMINQQGVGWFKENKLLFEEKATKALQRTIEARKRGVDANIDWWGPEWSAGMKKDAFAGMGIACWMQEFLTRDEPQTVGKWRVIRAPEGDYNWGGSFMAIPEISKNKDAAWEFVKHAMCTVEGQNAIFKGSGFLPAYKPAWKDPAYDEPVEFFGGQKTFRLWLEIAEGVPAVAVHPDDLQANDIVGAEFGKVEKEDKDPAQAMKDAEAEALKRIKGIEA